MSKTDQVAKRADIAPEAALEKTADQDQDHHKAAQVETDFHAGQDRRGGKGRAETAEFCSCKGQTEEQQDHQPPDRRQKPVALFIHRESFFSGLLTDQMHRILDESHRTEKTADRAAQKQGEADRGDKKQDDTTEAVLFKKPRDMRKKIAAALNQLVSVCGAGKYRKIDSGNGKACQDSAEHDDYREKDHTGPADCHKTGTLLPDDMHLARTIDAGACLLPFCTGSFERIESSPQPDEQADDPC